MLGAGCWVLGAECWVLNLPIPPDQQVPLSCPGREVLLPSQPYGSCAHWEPTHLPALAGPTASSETWPWPHQGQQGLDGAGGLCRGVVGGEAELGAAQFPMAQGTHSNAALASGIGGMAGAVGDLSWSLPSVTHTHHTPGRGQGQCWQCDGYWIPALPWGR